MTIEAKDLQSAITQASIQLQCSVMDIEYTVIQYPKQGFLGFFRKNAIIEARSVKKVKPKVEKKDYKIKTEEKISKKKDSVEKLRNFTQEKNSHEEVKKDFLAQEEHKEQESLKIKKEKYVVKSDAIFDSFHKESEEKNTDRLDEIKIQVKTLIDSLGFDIELVEFRMYDDNNILIKLDGKDSALLIGKGACRYKALSYLLHSWINSKYNLFIRLEISHFLENQTQVVQQYLQGVIEKIESTGRAQTKPLDGVLVKIALELLRERFPHKYVGIRQCEGDQKIIIVNDFIK